MWKSHVGQVIIAANCLTESTQANLEVVNFKAQLVFRGVRAKAESGSEDFDGE